MIRNSAIPLRQAVEEILYPAMEDFAIDIIVGKGPSANSIRLDQPHFTLIGATTNTRGASSGRPGWLKRRRLPNGRWSTIDSVTG